MYIYNIFTLPKELPVRDFNSVHINGVVELSTAITRNSFKLQSLEVSSSLALCRLTQTRSNTTAAVDGSLGACLRVATPFFTTGYRIAHAESMSSSKALI